MSEGSKNEPEWLFGSEETEERKHRMVRALEGKKKCHCKRCGKRSLSDRVPGCVKRLKMGEEESRKKENTMHSWKNRFKGGHHLQRVVDVGRVRTLIWCRKCAGWASESRLGKRLESVSKPRGSTPAHQLRKLEQHTALREEKNMAERRVSISWLNVGCTKKTQNGREVGGFPQWRARSLMK